MENNKNIPLKDLVKTLDQGVKSMNQGEDSSEDVNNLLTLAREIHERLAVLRHKVFEASVAEEEKVEEVALDNETDESQIDLIDSIEEVSLAEKHQCKPLSSIGEGLTILERANFTSILFSNDDLSFNDMLDAVDKCRNTEEATRIFRKAMKPSGRKEDIELAQSTFEARIPRIF